MAKPVSEGHIARGERSHRLFQEGISMPKRAGPSSSAALDGTDSLEKRRIDQLVTLVGHCTAAQAIADAQEDRFLSYMLAMTIQAARVVMHPRR